MDPCLSKKITKNCEFIENNLVRLSKVVNKLMEDDVLTLVDKTNILSAPSKETQINILLEKLINVGGTAFTSFVESLNATGNERIADQILQTDSSEDTAMSREETSFSDSTSGDFREDEILHLYKEKQMYKVKLSDMTTNYKQLQSELTVKEHKIECLNKEIHKLQIDLEENRKGLLENSFDALEGDIFRRMNTGANTRELMRKARDLQLALDEKEEKANNLQKDLEYYRSQLDIVEKQVKKQKDDNSEKDTRIMILRNQVGKLQNYLQASKQNLSRINNEQKRIMDQWNKEQLERFKEIENKMEGGKKDNSKRFNTLEDKIDILIKMMSAQGPALPNLIKSVEKSKPPVKSHKDAYGRKGKSNRYKN
ncbi:synaptonemal complex protein 1-like [Mytilus edulis]|uniref:synaptonemal complex protein 1-like n=1 Tax=Mytilus edulis TaxID=6550 RepID=UPI0039EE33DF